MKSLIVFPDGEEISSGCEASPAIKSLTCSRTAVAETDFAYGGACPAVVDVTLLDKSGIYSVPVGEEFIYYEVDSDGQRKKIGTFVVVTAKKASPYSLTLSAMDYMTKLDTDMSEWLANLDGWPYTINQILSMTTEYCGVSVAEDVELINGEHVVPQFITPVTGRKIIQWIGQANACFAKINADGMLTFSMLQSRGDLSAAIKKAKVSDYSTTPIARVVVKQSEDDVGVMWPEVEGESYEIVRNPLLATFTEEDLLSAVQNISEKIVGLTYTPANVVAWDENYNIAAGDIFSFRQGVTSYTTIAFTEKRDGTTVTLKSTGNSSRTAQTALYGKDPVDVIQGRVAEVKVELEMLEANLSETKISVDAVQRDSAQLKQTAAGLELRVEATEETASRTDTRLTALETDADSLELSIVSIRSQVDGKADKETVAEISETFRFDENGLTISNSATGMGIGVSEEQVAFTGGKDPTTVITPTEMETTNLRVGRQLDLGNFSLIPRTNGNLSMRWTGGE